MKILGIAAVFALGLGSSALAAEGDAAKGEKVAKKCKACHMVADDDGNVIFKGGKTGPNLWGIFGAAAASNADFTKYGKSLEAAGEAGLVWDQETLVAYLEDPTTFLRTFLESDSEKSKMTLKLKKEQDRLDVVKWLEVNSPNAATTN